MDSITGKIDPDDFDAYPPEDFHERMVQAVMAGVGWGLGFCLVLAAFVTFGFFLWRIFLHTVLG